MSIPPRLQSRKLWVAAIGLVVQVLAVWLSPEQAQQIGQNLMVIVSAYLVGQGVADHGKKK
jgi:uncharacterized protein (DUF2267 family)